MSNVHLPYENDALKTLIALLLSWCCTCAFAQDEPLWFTLMGSLADDTTDTVQINMAKMEARGSNNVMQLRVNLAHQRTMDSGEKYQSYLSKILIECSADSVVHLEQTRFELRRWEGHSTFQKFPEVRPMAFGGLEPNPRARVLRAACGAKRN